MFVNKFCLSGFPSALMSVLSLYFAKVITCTCLLIKSVCQGLLLLPAGSIVPGPSVAVAAVRQKERETWRPGNGIARSAGLSS